MRGRVVLEYLGRAEVGRRCECDMVRSVVKVEVSVNGECDGGGEVE